MKNYYAILEVPVGCSLEEIRQAYHRLVQEHLDDEAVFTDLKEAYEVLTTPTRRDEYDRTVWGETFEGPSQFAASADSALSPTDITPAGRCPMGAEAHCPVLLGRTSLTDKFCPECGYGLAALISGTELDLSGQSDPLRQAWLEERSGQTHALRNGLNMVGRENADILVPDKTVSRNHARLELEETGRVTVEDMSSTNGTHVNDEPLTPHVLRSLADGDRLRFGSISLTLHLPRPDATFSEAALPFDRDNDFRPPAEILGQVAEMREGIERVFPLAPGITTFGRRPENSVVLAGDLYVSGMHAQIRADGDVFILTDLGSTNGTLLNGERLMINAPFALATGDVIVIGGTSLRFERLGAEADAAEDDTAEADSAEDEESGKDRPNEPEADEADNEHMAETAPAEIPAEDAPRHLEG